MRDFHSRDSTLRRPGRRFQPIYKRCQQCSCVLTTESPKRFATTTSRTASSVRDSFHRHCIAAPRDSRSRVRTSGSSKLSSIRIFTHQRCPHQPVGVDGRLKLTSSYSAQEGRCSVLQLLSRSLSSRRGSDAMRCYSALRRRHRWVASGPLQFTRKIQVA